MIYRQIIMMRQILIYWKRGGGSQIRLANVIQNLASLTNANCLVDVGCGTGNVLKFAQRFFKKSIGFDISMKMLRLNKDKNAGLVCGDNNLLPFASGITDVVSCFSVIHHLYNFDLFLREAYRILKPGGWLYSDNDPNGFVTELYDLNKQSWLFRVLMGIYFIPLRFSKNFRERNRKMGEFRIMLEKDGLKEEFDRLSIEAEFHLHNGVNPFDIKSALEKIGFEDIRIYFHFRGNELRYNELTFLEKLNLIIRMVLKPKFSFFWQGRRLKFYELAPYFAILARKANSNT